MSLAPLNLERNYNTYHLDLDEAMKKLLSESIKLRGQTADSIIIDDYLLMPENKSEKAKCDCRDKNGLTGIHTGGYGYCINQKTGEIYNWNLELEEANKLRLKLNMDTKEKGVPVWKQSDFQVLVGDPGQTIKKETGCCGGVNKPENKRRYLPQIGELLDRLSILQLKELLLKEHRVEFAKEIQDILHDINLLLKEHNINISAETLRALIVLAQANLHIWHSESKARASGSADGSSLIFTHQENGVRTRARNRIQSSFGGRTDPKTDCLAAEFNHMEPSWDGK